jgi:hypothetical protein
MKLFKNANAGKTVRRLTLGAGIIGLAGMIVNLFLDSAKHDEVVATAKNTAADVAKEEVRKALAANNDGEA